MGYGSKFGNKLEWHILLYNLNKYLWLMTKCIWGFPSWLLPLWQGQATRESMILSLIFSGCSPPRPQHLSSSAALDMCTQCKTQWGHEGKQVSSWQWLGTYFLQLQNCAGHTAGHRSHHDGQAQSRQGRLRPGQSRQLSILSSSSCCPLPGSTQTKGTWTGIYT